MQDIIFLFVALIALVVISSRFYGTKDLPCLRRREALSPWMILERYYPGLDIPATEFEELWNDIADSFLVPAEKIRPDDRFGVELPFTEGSSDEDLFLGDALYRRMEEREIKGPIPTLERVDDYIQFLCKPRD